MSKKNDDVVMVKIKKPRKKPMQPSFDMRVRLEEERAETMRQVQQIMDACRRTLEDAYERDVRDLQRRLNELEAYRCRDMERDIADLKTRPVLCSGQQRDVAGELAEFEKRLVPLEEAKLDQRVRELEAYRCHDMERRLAALEAKLAV